ncbi:hypothetical protein L6164_031130 [Bauhinia variegata]|uniref:Uncharacterized protein n=1 Tax=Bauhinia variegata TaxID=167791 RepID=A0ACB9LEV8_BAUVA|nr:hypothetical protein L6164_031130 [Bauhinia variegata]
MKVPGKSQLPPTFYCNIDSRALNPSPDSDLQALRTSFRRRKPRTPGTRLRKNGAPNGRRSRPETPLLKWKIHDKERNNVEDDDDPVGKDEKSVAGCGRRACRKGKKQREVAVSARKLAAGLWRLQQPEVAMADDGRRGLRRGQDRLGVQHGIGHAGFPVVGHRNGVTYDSDLKNVTQSPHSILGTKTRHFCELEPSFQFSNSAMEGVTKWDPVSLKTLDEAQQIYSHIKLLDQKVSAVSIVSALEAELDQARARIQELETERRTSKKKLEHFLKKVSEERASWRSREHEKIRAYIDDVKTELNRERKNRQRIEIVNSKLVNELADAKLSAKRYMQDYEKERKARELIEEVCDELAKEIGEDKAEVEALKRESMKLREEVEEERKMLQMAEVWREERVQMKLVDAKVALEEKYTQMNKLVAELEAFLKSRGANPDAKEIREAQSLQQAAAAMNIQDIKGFSYEPSNPDDIFAIFEDANFGEPNEREIEQCVAYTPASHASKIHTVSPEANVISKDSFHRHSNGYIDDNGDIDEDESGWETVSHLEDQGSSCTLEGSDRRESNVSGSVLEWEGNGGEETPITEISEVCSVPPTKQSKKVSSIARFWRSCPNNGDNYKIISVEGVNGRLSNGRLSNGTTMSPDRCSGKGGLSPQDLQCHLSSPESGNPHKGMKGCIPRTTQKNSLKARLLEARMESQKLQLRHVLKQKI